jgi:signal transduction histidine kinase
VIDTGVGIDPKVHHQLFDEFYQVHNHERDRNKGFGMGLAIAQRLARQLGGDITVDSALGRGSRFSVCLPGVVGNALEAAKTIAIATQGSRVDC